MKWPRFIRKRLPCWLAGDRHRWEPRDVGSLVAMKDGTTLTIAGLYAEAHGTGTLIAGAEFCPDCCHVRMTARKGDSQT